MGNSFESVSTLASVVKAGVENRLKELHTAMPGIVQSFDAVLQLASVQPAIKRIFKTADGTTEILTPNDLPVLINVPVIFPRGGGFSLTFPVAKGNECLLVFCERSIDNWHKFGTVREPGARRFHHLSDATAFVGLSSIPNKVPNYDPTNMELKADDGSVSIKLKVNGGIRQENTNGFTELQPDGKFNINGIIFEEHIHAQGDDSGSDVQVDTEVPQ